MAKQEHNYYVYIMASLSHTLYCGMTNTIRCRTQEHRENNHAGFGTAYNCNRLVWFERFQYVRNAIDREKQIKRWGRPKKILLIESCNPAWTDLNEGWRGKDANPSATLRCGRDDKIRSVRM